QWARVTDTRGATEAGEVEAHSLKVLPQVCTTEVAVNNLGTRSTNGLNPWLDSRPSSAALRAIRPAPIMTDGLEVLVQEVMEAIATMPWSRVYSPPLGDSTITGLD